MEYSELNQQTTQALEEFVSPIKLKRKLLELLHNIGIPENKISVKQFTLEKSKSKPNSKSANALGYYISLSQFTSSPIMYFNVANTYKTLIEIGDILIDDSFNDIKDTVFNHCLDTICHEYGHVIEEVIHFKKRSNHSTLEDKIKSEKMYNYFYEHFIDNEEFAEEFGIALARDEDIRYIPGVDTILTYYNHETFSNDLLDWVKQPKMQRELELFFNQCKQLDKYYENYIGYLGMSKQACTALNKQIQSQSLPYTSTIIKCSQPLNLKLLGCDEVRFPEYSHHVLKVESTNETIFFDLMSEHTFGKAFLTQQELKSLWGNIGEISPHNKNNKQKKLKQ